MATTWCYSPDLVVTRNRGVCREAYVSTQQEAPVSEARLPRAHVHPRRSSSFEGSAPEGSQAAVGLIGRLHRREEFARLRREGIRVRSGALWCTMLLDPSLDGPRVAFAIGRTAGNAVERNRARRRCREAFRDRDFPAGLYLIGLTRPASSATFTQVTQDLDGILARTSL